MHFCSKPTVKRFTVVSKTSWRNLRLVLISKISHPFSSNVAKAAKVFRKAIQRYRWSFYNNLLWPSTYNLSILSHATLCIDDFLVDVEGGLLPLFFAPADPFVDLWLMKNHADDLLLFHGRSLLENWIHCRSFSFLKKNEFWSDFQIILACEFPFAKKNHIT